MVELIHKEVTRKIIGTYYRAYNRLGNTYPERIYENAMMWLIQQQGVECIRQAEYEIRYKNRIVGRQRLDLFVAGTVIVELKVAPQVEPIHLAQLVSYMKTLGKQVGLLFRFGGPEPEFVRRVLTASSWSDTLHPRFVASGETDTLLYPAFTHEILGGALDVFKHLGPGYIHRIYANACFQELQMRGLPIIPHREFHVFWDEKDLGVIKFKHIQIDNKVLLFPVALSDVNNLRINNLKAWMQYLNIPIGIVVNYQTTWLEPMILRI